MPYRKIRKEEILHHSRKERQMPLSHTHHVSFDTSSTTTLLRQGNHSLAQVATDRRSVIHYFVFDDSLPLIVVLVPAH